ncbi:MAG: TIGR03915 family putative DNA repair protein [Clostridia bacterium]|nr:TIGR03915 family putative DNA repair protein [Clostridia bacterium]
MIYFFDGTKEGFLTAFLAAFQDDNALVTSRKLQLILGEEPLFITTDCARAKKAEERLLSFDRHCMDDLDILLRCGMEDHEQVAFRYLRLLAKRKRPIGKMLAESDVFTAVEYIKKVRLEIHHLHGFIRFMETASGALYAPFSPDHDICDLLLPHFRARLPEYPFVLHDVKRQKAAVYDGKNTFLAPLSKAELVLSSNEEGWQSLWKKYYHSVNIPSRERLRQMRGYMPVRYWKFMPEKQETPPTFQEE